MAVLMREAIGDSLRRIRTARRRTLREVSRRARVSLGYLSEVERGRKEPSSELLAAICDALDIAVHELLSDAAGTMATETVPLRPLDLRLAAPPAAEPLLSTPVAAPAAPAAPTPTTGRVRAAA